MHRYEAYGLSIATSIPLPELPPADPSASGAPDIQFLWEPLGTPPEPGSVPASTDGKQVVIAWGNYVTLRMRDGRECAFDSSDALAEAMLRRYLLGPGLGILLHQRGLLVLHASAVSHGGEAVLFIGEKGAGKSTTAAGLLARGHTLLSDDVVAIDLTDPARPLVLPAFAQIRLRPDSAAAVAVPDDELATTNLTLDKRLWQVHDRFQSAPVPVREINVLDRGVPGTAQELASDAALAQLLTHLYAPRFAGTSVMAGAHLQACATLLGAVTVRRLSRSESMSDLPFLLDAVEGDGRAA